MWAPWRWGVDTMARDATQCGQCGQSGRADRADRTVLCLPASLRVNTKMCVMPTAAVPAAITLLAKGGYGAVEPLQEVPAPSWPEMWVTPDT